MNGLRNIKKMNEKVIKEKEALAKKVTENVEVEKKEAVREDKKYTRRTYMITQQAQT
jgi:hypothetical protein